MTTLTNALDQFTQTWDEFTVYQLAGRFSYAESDALAELLDALGQRDIAVTLMVSWWAKRESEDDDQMAPYIAGRWIDGDAAGARWDSIADGLADQEDDEGTISAASVFDIVRRVNQDKIETGEM